VLFVLLAASLASAETERGRIAGRIVREDGSGVSGVSVTLDDQSRPAVSDASGRFSLERVEPGTHSLTFTQGSNMATESDLQVTAGVVTGVHRVVDWSYVYAESLTVRGASRRVERIVDAPAAVSVVTSEKIEREASSGQLPRLLETAPGVQLAQSGVYDFKFNARGLDTMLNRRVAVLIDGRNPSFPLVGAQEWAAVGFPLDDLETAELVRGPSSALYGANAFNGVLNLTTKSPRDHTGGYARLTVGELSTLNADLSAAGALGGDWYVKALAGYHGSGNYTRSRTSSVEYSVPCPAGVFLDCVPLEAAALVTDRVEIPFASLRFDKAFDNGPSLVIEGGSAEPEGHVQATAGGRFQFLEVKRPWARVDLSGSRWNVLGYYTGRDSEALTLSAGLPSSSDGDRYGLEAQTRWNLAGDRGRLVAGLSYIEEKVDTADRQGRQTLLFRPVDPNFRALFAQFDYDLNDRLKLVIAGRYDDSSLFSSQFSPKASVVYSLAPAHTLRAGFNQAFLAPSYPEYFVRLDIAPPLDLGVFESIFCAPVGVSCGFDRPVPFLAVGNENLDVEKIQTWELGYSGILGQRTFLTADLFYNKVKGFVRTGVPNIGPTGRVNPDFGPYMAPSALPPELAAALEATLQAALTDFLYPFLSNPTANEPLLAFITLANVGRLESRGLELSLDHAFDDNWTMDVNYTWLDFDYQEELPGSPLGFNSPEHRLSLGVSYVGDRLAASASYRWVDSYRFTEAVVNGVIESYGVTNLVVNYGLSDAFEIGLNVSNLLDDRHYEVFTGDILERRALVNLTYRW
jgi:iron complex outermembrane receptor protein